MSAPPYAARSRARRRRAPRGFRRSGQKRRSADGSAFQESPRGRPVPLSASIAAACRASSATWSAAYALAAGEAVLLVREEHDAHRAARVPRQRGDLTRRLDDDAAPGAVVDGAAAEVPGVEVRAEDHDLSGRFPSRYLADHVGRFGVRPRAARRARCARARGRPPRAGARAGRRRESRARPPGSSARRPRTRALRCGEAGCRRCRSNAPARRRRRVSRRGRGPPSDRRRSGRSPSHPSCGRSRTSKNTIRPRTASRRASSSSKVVMRTTSASTPSGAVATDAAEGRQRQFLRDRRRDLARLGRRAPRPGRRPSRCARWRNRAPSSSRAATATASRSPGEPARRGPTRSVSSRTHSDAREPAAMRSRSRIAACSLSASSGPAPGAREGAAPVIARPNRAKARAASLDVNEFSSSDLSGSYQGGQALPTRPQKQ